MPSDGRNRILIYGPKDDGTYTVEFKTRPDCQRGCASATLKIRTIRHSWPLAEWIVERIV